MIRMVIFLSYFDFSFAESHTEHPQNDDNDTQVESGPAIQERGWCHSVITIDFVYTYLLI